MTAFQTNYYQHYKGNIYQLLAIAIHSETQEELVIYRALYFNAGKYGMIFARPKAMFFSNVVVDGIEVPRFARLTDEEYSMSTEVYK